jgi:C-terminal processing protease CtpA/Prc
MKVLIMIVCPAMLLGQAVDSTARARRQVVDSAIAILSRQYVSSDTAQLIGARLRAQSERGAYATVTDSAFRATVTSDLRSVNGDLHLSLVRRPSASNGSPPVAPPFIGGVEILGDSVGLLELQGMARPTPENVAALRAALQQLAGVRALIVDVRRNPGGAAPMNDTLWSYFVADSQPTAIVYTRASDATVERFALPRREAPRFSNTPIFILTSPATASAAEGFTFFLQQSGRARVVGTRTAGAGHIVAGFPIDETYALRVSVARVRNPRTGREWERTGVIPDVAVDASLALERAQALARAAIRSAER